MVKHQVKKNFRPLRVLNDVMLVTGGYNRSPEACPFRTAMVGGEKKLFMHMEAREAWLIKGATAKARITKGLSLRTTLLSEMREKLQAACNGEQTVPATLRCRGEVETASSSAADPMAEVAEDEVVSVQCAKFKGGGIKRNRYFNSNCKNKVLEITMPERARESGFDEGERVVRLYCECRSKIWLCSEDADWALKYLRDQLDTKGVCRVHADDRGPGAEAPPPDLERKPVVAGHQLSSGHIEFHIAKDDVYRIGVGRMVYDGEDGSWKHQPTL